MGSAIVGTGVATPPNEVTNHDLARIMDTSDEWIQQRSGVERRRFADEGVGSSALAVEACLAAMADAGLEPDDIDLLVTATMTPDVQAPGISAVVQHAVGLGRVPAFDLRQQCSGFLYGLELADAMLSSGRASAAIVVGAEVHGGYLPWGETWDIVLGRSDRTPTPEEYQRNTRFRAWSVLFGDGAGAIVLRSDPHAPGFLASHLASDGSQSQLIFIPGLGFSRRPYVDRGQIDDDLHLPTMDGAGLYRMAVRLMPETVESVLDSAGLTPDDLDLVIAHQANERILDGVRKRLGASADLVPSNIADWGNTTSATLPILFHEMRMAGRVPSQALVCFTAFGAGAHWGSMLYRHP